MNITSQRENEHFLCGGVLIFGVKCELSKGRNRQIGLQLLKNKIDSFCHLLRVLEKLINFNLKNNQWTKKMARRRCVHGSSNSRTRTENRFRIDFFFMNYFDHRDSNLSACSMFISCLRVSSIKKTRGKEKRKERPICVSANQQMHA